MKLAFECSTPTLDLFQPLADFDFILTHLVLKDKDYAAYYANSNRLKILDNSVNETGRPTTLAEIAEAAAIVNPHIIIPPDYLGDHFSTMSALEKTLQTFKDKDVLPVVQGSSIQYIESCMDQIMSHKPTLVAVPYTLLHETDGASMEVMASSRVTVIDTLHRKYPKVRFHLLGMTTLEELEYCTRYYPRTVTSLDTGFPIANGLHGKVFGKDVLLTKTGPTLDKINEAGDESIKWAFYNIAYLRRVVNGNF